MPPPAESGRTTPRFPIWSLLWRMVLYGPLLMPLGLLILAASFAVILLPIAFAVLLFAEGSYALGSVLLFAGILIVRHGFRLISWLLQGIEHSSL